MSPGLFNLLTADLEEHMKKRRWEGVRLKGEKVYTLAYARYRAVGGRGRKDEDNDSKIGKICRGERAGSECREVKGDEVWEGRGKE